MKSDNESVDLIDVNSSLANLFQYCHCSIKTLVAEARHVLNTNNNIGRIDIKAVTVNRGQNRLALLQHIQGWRVECYSKEQAYQMLEDEPLIMKKVFEILIINILRDADSKRFDIVH